MNLTHHKSVLGKVAGLFDRRLIQNNLRGLYVEWLVEDIIAEGWRVTSENWSSWDLDHDDGTKLEVKQSAAQQTWQKASGRRSKPSFSIKAPAVMWDGAEKMEHGGGRPADIYVFAWHPETGATADHRDADQWKFYVIPTSRLPDQDTIGLGTVQRLADAVSHQELKAVVDTVRLGLPRSAMPNSRNQTGYKVRKPQ